MTTLDDQIRDLLRDGLADAPEPLTSAEIQDRWNISPISRTSESSARRRWPVAILAAAACLVLAVIATSRRHDPDERQAAAPTASTQVGVALSPPAFVLPEMPAGWVLVDAHESEGHGDWGDRVAIYTRVDPPARLEVHHVPGSGTTLSNERRFTFTGGEGSWNPVASLTESGVSLDLVRDGEYISAQGWDVEASEASVRAIAESLSVGADGVPVMDPGSGFELHAAGRGATVSTDRGLRYARPDDPEVWLSFNASSGPGLLDADLSLGAFAEPVERAGRTFWADPGGHQVAWSDGDDRYTLYGRPGDTDLVAVAASARVVSSETFHDTIEAIGTDAEVVDRVEFRLAERDLVIEDRAVGTSALVCLVAGETRVCRSIGPPGTTLSDATVSLVLDGHWYVLQGSANAPDPTPAIATVDVTIWRVSAVADDVDAVRIERSTTEWFDLSRPLR